MLDPTEALTAAHAGRFGDMLSRPNGPLRVLKNVPVGLQAYGVALFESGVHFYSDEKQRAAAPVTDSLTFMWHRGIRTTRMIKVDAVEIDRLYVTFSAKPPARFGIVLEAEKGN